jgi:4-diphosphocytidyl-2-C-methyl-D-erythritol kinase
MIYEKAHAKINLVLDVGKKRDDGFHDLNMIMIPLDLHDHLTFKLSDEVVLSSNLEIKNNLVLKTVYLIKEKYKIEQGVEINLVKHIPVGAGLAGGSADIAATIRGLNRLWKLKLEKKEMEEIALILGSDTLFCLYEKPAYVYGRGENIEFLDKPALKNIYLFYPDIEVSTALVFKNHQVNQQHNFSTLLDDYKNQRWDLFYKNAYNDLIKTTFLCYPQLTIVYEALKNIDPMIQMSGSGSTFFSINSKLNLSKILKNTKKMGVKTLKTGIKT